MNMQNKETVKKEDSLKRQYVTFSIGDENFGIDVAGHRSPNLTHNKKS
jgi:chemotaxis signal transduction protein